MKLTYRQQKIIEILKNHPNVSISEIRDFLNEDISQPTLNRDLAKLVELSAIEKTGKARAIRYRLSTGFKLFEPIDLDEYFTKEIDFRNGKKQFNNEIFSVIEGSQLFTVEEEKYLVAIKDKYMKNIKDISVTIYQKELERLTIDLSWKSSQIEGNTYSLLETEQLLTNKIEATNKTKEEAIMLLNHKDALNYIAEEPQMVNAIRISIIEDIHSILIKDLGVDKNIRTRPVGVTGTTYTPPDNEFQIREYLQRMCDVVNAGKNGFEKALLTIAMISYIQPFGDGNKRTCRIMGNAFLMADNNCPLSYRSVNSLDYKKAMLVFYEQNNIQPFKELFIKQYEFAVKNYFLG
jgi:Fic family protein